MSVSQEESAKKDKVRRKTARIKKSKKEEGKVLTFVDMSHLSYLSKSVSTSNAFMKKQHDLKPVVIPKDTKAAIEEDISEEDYDSEEAKEPEPVEDTKKDMTVQEVAIELFDQILNVIFEAHDP